ncbi:replication factor-a protein [Vararia minispora EC-137]|uniref:Replication factor-a protein n=1 Tax=Vararia minispora EC-137 TaxID=1314806 RepID=A0ACB8QMF5_9AGAM|nr:replication factor-a protein [Vararia minispora EC-137]
MSIELSSGHLVRMYEGDLEDPEIWGANPTLQLLSIKKVPSDGTRPDRYRIIISDGIHFCQAMLATQLNYLAEKQVITKHSIVTLENVTGSPVSGKRILILHALRIVERNAEKVGDPKSLLPANEAAAEAAPAPRPVPSSSTVVSAVRSQTQGQQRRSGKTENLYPIEALSPYQNNWTIKARVTQKSDIRHFSNARGEGKLFSVTFMDESGDIKGTAFNAAAEDLYDRLQEGKVYYISKARVDIAKKKFSNNQYELGLNVNTEIEEVTDATQAPVIKYNFVKLQDLNDVEKDAMCDVIAVIKSAGDVGQITTKAQKTLTKRELTLVDSSQFAVRLTLWGKQAETFQATEQEIVAFKGVKVGDFGGRSLSMISTSMMELNPDIPEAHALKGWYIDGGSDQSFRAYNREGDASGSVNRTEMRTIHEAKTTFSEASEKPEYFSIRATVLTIKNDNIAYPACRSESCNKKVVEDQSSNTWRCEKCEKSWDSPEYRYIISMAVADHTDQMWLQGFNDAGVAVLNMSADDLMMLKERDENAFNNYMSKVQGKLYNIGVRAKQDTWNETTRIRYGITRIQPVDFVLETQSMLMLLKSSWGQNEL